MSRKLNIYTETMARVYADQGHWNKVVEIYRHLLNSEPGRQDYAAALAEAEDRVAADEASRQAPDRLVPLFREWIELLFEHQKIQKLRQWKSRGRDR